MSSTVIPIRFSVFFWTLLWIGCSLLPTAGSERLQNVTGVVILNGPPPAYASCHRPYPSSSLCWPSTAHNLKNFGRVTTCFSSDRADGVTEIFTSEKISCEYSVSSMRHECHVHLSENQIPLFIGLNVTSNGTIHNYTTLNQERRTVTNPSRPTVAVLHMIGYPPLDRQSTAFPFSARVYCEQSEGLKHCQVSEVMLLLVKYSCF